MIFNDNLIMNSNFGYAINAKIGKRYGHLTAISPISPKDEWGKWKFKCDCGKEIERSIYSAMNSERRGYISSCGCAKQREKDVCEAQRIEIKALRAEIKALRAEIKALRSPA